MEKNFFYYLSPSIIIGALSTFVMVPVTTYYLEPKDFGIFAIINAIVMPIGPLASTGVTWVLAGNYYKIGEEERKALLFNLLILDFTLKLFLVMLFWFLSFLLLPFIIKEFEPHYTGYFKLILLATLFSSLWPTVSYLIVLQQKAKLHGIFEMIPWICGAMATIISLTIFNLKAVALFLNPLISGIVSFLLGLGYIKEYISPKIKKKWLTEIFKVGMPSIPANLVEMLTNISDRYFIQKWINLSQLGIYSHSQSYKSIFTMGTKAFSRSFSPSLLEAFSNNRETETIKISLKKWYRLLAIAGVFITLFSYEIVDILTHGKFVKAAPLVPIWFFLVLSFTYGLPATQILFVHKKNQFMMYSSIIIGLIFIGITAFSVYQFGLLGAVISIVLSNFCIQIVRTIYAKKLGYNNFLKKYFMIVLILIVLVYLINQIFMLFFPIKVLLLILFYIYIFSQFELSENMKNVKI